MRKLMVCYFILFLFLLFIIILPLGCTDSGHKNNSFTNEPEHVPVSPTLSDHREWVRRECLYFKISDTKEITRLSESEYILLDLDDDSEIIKVIIDYYSDGTYCVNADWLCQPTNTQILNIRLDHIRPDVYYGYLLCNRSCEGTSPVFDLNHIYNMKKYYHFNEQETSDSLVNIECGDASAMFYIDITKHNFCPYYTELAVSRGCFEKHTVWWKKVLFRCSGSLSDIDQAIEIDIRI